MKRHKCCILLAVMALFLSVASAGYASQIFDPAQKWETDKVPAHRIVRVGYVQAARYQEGGNGEYMHGFGYEYMQRIAAVAGWKYEYHFMDFAEALEALKKGEIDLLPDLNYTPERAAVYDYAAYPMLVEQYQIYCDRNRDDLHSGDPSSLNGKRIASREGTFQTMLLEKWLAETGTEAEIVLYKDTKSFHQCLEKGEADAVAIASLEAPAHFIPLIVLAEEKAYFCTTKGNKEVLDELNDALGYLQRATINFNEVLYSKYFSATLAEKAELSKDEEEWLMQHLVLRVGCIKGILPFVDFDKEQGKATGMVTAFFDEALKPLALGLKVEYKFYTGFNELAKAMAENQVDVMIPTVFDFYLAEQEGVIQSNILTEMPASYIHAGNKDWSKSLRIAVRRNGLAQYYASVKLPQHKLLYYTTADECAQAVLRGEADGMLVGSYRSGAVLLDHSRLEKIDLTEGMAIAFSVRRSDGALLKLLNRALGLFPRDRANAAMVKYTVARQEETLAQALHEHRNVLLVAVVILLMALIGAVHFWWRARKANEALGRAITEAKDASEAKSRFLFNMSHDIRTPMNAIIGFTDRAEKNKDNPEILKDCFGKIKASNNYLLRLINDVLDMARIESGKLNLEVAVENLPEEVETHSEAVRQLAEERKITFTTDFSGIKHSWLWLDKLRVRQVMENVLSNSIKYTKNGGKISFSITEAESPKPGCRRYVFTVSDTGIGMSEEFLEHIFEQFSRVENSTVSKVQGTGLGMAIVKRLVDLMDGTIELRSKLGEGTTTRIALDFRLADKEEAEAENLLPEITEDTRFDGMRVLLVEDNELNQEIARGLLEDFGVTVEVAGDGSEAVEKVEQSGDGYDLILMDIQMPYMNGYQAARIIRTMENEKLRNIPISAMTANAFEEDRKNAFAAGMNDHLAKPIDISALLAILKKYQRVKK